MSDNGPVEVSDGKKIDGKQAAAALRETVRKDAVAFHDDHGVKPGLAVIIVGDNPASRAYVRTKTRMADEAAIHGQLIELAEDTDSETLLAEVARLNDDASTHGILVQLPLPAHIDEAAVLDAIRPDKDVDGFHPLNVGKLFSVQKSLPENLLVPCTPYGCLHLLKQIHGDGLSGKHAVVVGRSNIVGKPMAMLLLTANCTVTVAHSRTEDLPKVCREADILVAAVGRANMIEGDWVKPGATVIDVGINRIEGDGGKSRLTGDVDFDGAVHNAAHITPVPGGVGPMTVACLLRNTVIAARNQVN